MSEPTSPVPETVAASGGEVQQEDRPLTKRISSRWDDNEEEERIRKEKRKKARADKAAEVQRI
jgi:hypothetical protein